MSICEYPSDTQTARMQCSECSESGELGRSHITQTVQEPGTFISHTQGDVCLKTHFVNFALFMSRQFTGNGTSDKALFTLKVT